MFLRPKVCLVLVVALLLVSHPGFYSSTCSAEEIQHPEISGQIIEQLATQQQWLDLLHYRAVTLIGGYESQIDDARFFFSSDGKIDPRAEMRATIEAFLNTAKDAQCRFPARFYWLTQKLRAFHIELPAARCEELELWYRTINPKSVTLVFPAAHLNSPSSMFGHTLLRINPADRREKLPLVAYALNYAANVTQEDNNLIFAYRGIFGGYPGVFSIVPYHEKIKEYSDIENRDLWEYDLDLGHEEVLQLLRHAWELRSIRSDYYFFTENCSYMLLTLLQVAKPEQRLTDQFVYKAIPVDTVRAVITAGLVKETHFRPSSVSLLDQRFETLNDKDREVAAQLIDQKVVPESLSETDYTDLERAKLYEISYDTLRYKATDSPSERDKNASYNYQLLAARSKINLSGIWPEAGIPSARADQGHGSARLAAGYHHKDTKDKLFIKIRPAYHDLLDPPEGFQPGAQINFLDLELSHTMGEDSLQIENLTFIDIVSLSPRNTLFKPLSWKVNFGLDNKQRKDADTLVLQVNPGFGYTYKIGQTNLVSMFLDGQSQFADEIEDNYALGLGPTVLWTQSANRYSAFVSLNANRFFAGEHDTTAELTAGVGLHFDKNYSLRFSFSQHYAFEQYYSQQRVALQWYF